MKKYYSFYFIFLIPLLLFCQDNNSPDKYLFGKYNITSGNGRIAEKNILKISGSPKSLRMVKRVGGISFEQIAQPEKDLIIDTIILSYDSSSTDGNRLKVSLYSDDDYFVTAKIPDWQLIPIANYVDSEYTALVSIYGQNISLDKTPIVYHKSVANTLLGLRLFHADMLLADTSGTLWNLPKKYYQNSSKPKIVAGTGEDKLLPDSSQLHKYNYAFEQLKEIKEFMPSESYIITDYDSNVEFTTSNNQLLITGEPYFLFNSTTIDPQAYLKYVFDYTQQIKMLDSCSIKNNKQLNRIEEIYLEERFSWNKKEVERIVDNLYYIYVETEYIEALQKELKKIKIPKSLKNKFPYKDILNLKEIAKKDTTMRARRIIDSLFIIEKDIAYHKAVNNYYKKWKKKQKRKEKYTPLDRYDISYKIDSSMIAAELNKDIEILYNLYENSTRKLGEGESILQSMKYINFELILEQEEEVYIHGCLIEGMKANNQHIYNYNPAVMNATIQTMRYAAFFRYVKKNYPLQWNTFLKQVQRTKENIYNNIKTPIKFSVN